MQVGTRHVTTKCFPAGRGARVVPSGFKEGDTAIAGWIEALLERKLPGSPANLVSANASTTEPAVLLAYLICDHDAPLSTDLSDASARKETAQ